jgi:diguanylate cyclase (GGDEF)-like protein
MNSEPVRILFVEDSQTDVELLLRTLRQGGFQPEWQNAYRLETLRGALTQFDPDIILSDFSMPELTGLEVLKLARELRPDVPLVFVSGTIGEERAIEALREGATDYVLKGNLSRLVPAFRRALREHKERAERERAQRQLATQYAVARELAAAASIEQGAPKLLRAICENLGFVISALWEVDPPTGACRCAGLWHIESAGLTEFAARTREISSFVATGVQGRVLHSGKTVWIRNATEDPNFVRAPYAVNAGLRSAVAFPIMLRGEITGIVDVFSTEARPPDAEVLRTFDVIGSQIGQFMEHQAQQEHITRLNRIYAVLSEINSTIVRVRDRQELFNETCRIVVEQGGFGMAWIGTFDPSTLDVTPVAWAGFKAEELIIVSAKSTARADVPQGQGAIGRAIREKRPVFDNDITVMRGVGGKRRQEAVKRGYRSLIVLPLMVEGEVTGTLALFARERGFFTKEEVKLLTDLAGDVSFALEHIGQMERLLYLANYDALTGLANRSLLSDRLTQAMTLGRRYGHLVAVAILDLDNFKLINESLGHKTGDELLKVVAERLRGCVRASDTLARLGSDEFVLVLPGQTSAVMISRVAKRLDDAVYTDQRVIEMLQRILTSISEPVLLASNELRLTCSIGVSLFPQDGADVDALLRNAGAALSRAKQLGRRNFQFYTAELNARVAERLSLHSSLRRALEHDEFVLHYQPKVNLQTGEMSGVEALLRWSAPDSRTVPPGDFIPVLEETGLIVDVGRLVIEKALAEYAEWGTISAQPPRIAVNMSPLELTQAEFPGSVEKILKNAASGAVGLDFEITESLIMQDLEANIPKLRAIKEMGINIAIDDFGTGYSSLSYLARLPVNALKIDRMFISGMEASSDQLAIVATIISLAHSLGLVVVAEGVETEWQVETLLRLKCDEMQGYVVAAPMSGEQFRAWWRRFSPKPAGSRKTH